MAEFLEAGLSIVIATRGADLAPNGARAWAVSVDADRKRLTAYVPESEAAGILPDLRANGRIALGFGNPTDDHACQVKGVFLSARAAATRERETVDQQVEGFRQALEAVGIPRALTPNWKTWPCVALEIQIQDLFVQTPGPGAGERVR